jgi:beta-lactamase superfamily II metal-dependent hydrolase
VRPTSPADDVLEVSLFGRGVGECVVVHLGAGDWMIVDSFKVEREPVALRYLRALGVSPRQVRAVVVTHWDDDHVRGVAEIVKHCRGARFVCSGALRHQEFTRYIKLADRLPAVRPFTSKNVEWTSGVTELSEAYDRIASHSAKVKYVGEEDLVWPPWSELDASRSHVVAWSPAPATFMAALEEARQLFNHAKAGRRVRRLRANDLSVALMVTAGQRRVLLGGDLENTGNDATGWHAVVASDLPRLGRAEVFKVPHHGSLNGDHDDIWKRLLVQHPYAAVTTFSRSRLPRRRGKDRLLARTSRAYLAGLEGGRRDRDAERRQLASIASVDGLWSIEQGVGQIRLRAPIGGVASWSVACEGEAHQLVR